MSGSRRNQWLRIVVILLVCTAFFLCRYLLNDVHYETDDDLAMNLIAAGAYDEAMSAYLIFSNILYGYLLKILFHLIPNHNMYLELMLGLNFFSIFAISYISGTALLEVVKARRSASGEGGRAGLWYELTAVALTTILVNLFLCDDFYNALQFTKNAGLYTAVGGMLFIWWFFRGARIRNLAWLPAIFFLVTGYCVRKDSFKAALPFVVVGFLSALILFRHKASAGGDGLNASQAKSKVGAFGKNWSRKGALAVTLLGCVAFVVPVAAHHAAYSTDDWQYYYRYHDCRSRILDYCFPAYDGREGFQAHDLDELDMDLLLRWIYVDTDKFTLENMEWLRSVSDSMLTVSYIPEARIIEDVATTMWERLFSRRLALGWLCLLLVFLCLGYTGLTGVQLLLSLLIFGEYYYLRCNGRIMWRVEALIWIVAFVTLAGVASVAIKPRKERQKAVGHAWLKRAALLSLVCVFLLDMEYVSGRHYFNVEKNQVYFQPNGVQVDMVRELNQNPQHFYLWTTMTYIQPTRIDDISKTNYSGYYANLYPTGGWTAPSPLHKSKLERYGINNPLLSLVENNGNMFLIDSMGYEELLRSYLEKETGRAVSVTEQANYGGYKVWKYEYAA